VTNQDASAGSDIGTLIKSISKIASTMCNLSNYQKYSLLFNYVELPSTLTSTYAFGCDHKFDAKWLGKYTWLTDKWSFCGLCSVLSTDNRTERLTG